MHGTNEIIALDVNSKSLIGLIAIEKSQKMLSLKSVESVDYSGYSDGAWLDEGNLKEMANLVLKRTLASFKGKKNVLYVSVPSEFAAVKTKTINVEYDRAKTITYSDLDYIYSKGNDFDAGEFIPINASAVGFSFDGNSWTMENPIGVQAQKISTHASYIFCEKSFCDMFISIAKKFKFKQVVFIATAYSEALTLFEAEERFNELLLIDFGHLSTSVSNIKGDGVLDLKSFSLGYAHIAANIYFALEIPYEDAMEALTQIDLNLHYDENETYTTKSGLIINLFDVAEIVKESLNVLISTIKEAVVLMAYQGSNNLPFYFTGDGLANFRGATKYIERGLIKELELIYPKLPSYNKPQFSSAISLITMCVETLGKRAGRIIYF